MAQATSTIALPSTGPAGDTAAGSITFIGCATVLIRYAGLTILTDPTFVHMHEQVSIGYGMHATRLTNPAMDVADLPPLDLILLSHFHGDHFDQVAERDLDKALPIVTTPAAVDDLTSRGFTNTHPIGTWESVEVVKGDARLRISATPGRHGPPVVAFALPEVMGSVLDFESPGGRFRVYVTGDTLIFDDVKEIPRHFPDVDLALMHLGGTMIMGVLLTMNAEQGIEMMRIVEPRVAIPIHYDDYDVFKEPRAAFEQEVRAAGLEDRVHYLDRGESYAFRVHPAS
jgi:L-ascorbate metabolism protein UlaG (beta-lactamase superfamily)